MPGDAKKPWTEREMKQALYRHFDGRWVVLTECTTLDEPKLAAAVEKYEADRAEQEARTGRTLGVEFPKGTYDRRIDVLMIKLDARMAIEIKVSRADLLADLADPSKQAPWVRITHQHAYAVPAEMVELALERVPPEHGVISVERKSNGYYTVGFARRAKKRKSADPLPDRVQRGFLHRLAAAEAHMKGLTLGTHDDDVESLRARLERAIGDADIERRRAWKFQEERDEWRSRYALHDHPPCGICGEPVVPTLSRKSRLVEGTWKHLDGSVIDACEALWIARYRPERYQRHVDEILPADPAEQPGEMEEKTA